MPLQVLFLQEKEIPSLFTGILNHNGYKYAAKNLIKKIQILKNMERNFPHPLLPVMRVYYLRQT